MPTGHGYLIHREWSAQSASETAPTTATTGFENPQFFPGADALRVTFSEFTVSASDTTVTFRLWLKTRSEDGTEFVVPYDDAIATLSGSSTTLYATPSTTTVSDAPAGSWYVQLDDLSTSGTASVTGSVKLQYVQEND